MKNLLMLVSLAAVSLGLSSCCSMFGKHTKSSGYRTETRQVRAWGYDTVREEVVIKGTRGSKGGLVTTVEKKVPRYKTVTKKTTLTCNAGVHRYCPSKDCGGTISESTVNMASAQGSSGSPNIGLLPTMKILVP